MSKYDELMRLLAEGFKAHQKGDLIEARRFYEEILSDEPTYFDARQLIGVVCLMERKFQDAVQHFKLALEVNSHHAVTHNNLGLALIELGQYEPGLASCDKALGIDPKYPEALYNRGLALENLGQPDQAIASYDKSIAERPDYDLPIARRARLLMKIGKLA